MSPAPPAPAASDNLRGIIAMVVAVTCFVISDLIIKYAGQGLPPGELMFLRGIFAAVITACVAAATGALKSAWKALTPLMALRCLGDIGANLFFFMALVRMPFAEVNAIGQFAPLALTAGAALFLKEPVGWRRWMALAVGLIGVLIIIRPGGDAFDWAAVYVIFSVISVTGRDLITRHMGVAFPILLLSLISATSVMIGGLAMAPFETWYMPSNTMMLMMIGAGLAIFIGNYKMVAAMRTGELAVVAPFRYCMSPIAIVGGYFVFSEMPDALTFLGIAVVIGAGLYTLHRERVRRRTTIKSIR